MKVLCAFGLLLTALLSPTLHADDCSLPAFLQEGRSYDFQTQNNVVSAQVLEADPSSCWIRISERDWINLAHVTSITDTTVGKLLNNNSPVGRWSCQFAASGKHLGNFTYAENGELVIAGAGSNRKGTWAIDANNTLIWRYEGGGGEELDTWSIENGVMNITEGSDQLICNRL